MRIAIRRTPGAERVVTPLELFFDLVYVFALGELSHHLAEHVDARTGAETLVLSLAVFYAWYMTAWGANWLAPDGLAVRLLLVGLMFASLLMAVGISEAFGSRAWLFVTGYLILQLGRTAFLVAALRGSALGEHFVNALVWEAAGGALLVAGARAGEDARLALWCAAMVVAYAGVWSLHWLPGRGRRTDLGHADIAAGHIAERFRLFFIIALGETVLTAGAAFTAEPFTAGRLLALALAFAGTVALWWCYFQREGSGIALGRSAEGAGALGWWGTWTLTLIVLALIGTAVADQMAIDRPGGDATPAFTALAFGGPALFLLAQLVFVRGALGSVPRSRVLGLVAMGILAAATAPLTMIAGIAGATAALAGVAVADTLGEGARA